MARHTTIDSNDVMVTSDDGTDGASGTEGISGGVGDTGSNSLDVRAVAPAGSFLLGPSGTWTVEATSGKGGDGGAGGNALALNGGDGGDGGDSGSATAILGGIAASFAANQTVVIDVTATSGDAGSGGTGGLGGADFGALSGNDGMDGTAGAASVNVHSLHFTSVGNMTLSLDATGGDGGMGDSAGGDASLALSNAKFTMVPGSDAMVFEADATGGNGGASGGANGSATVAMTSVNVKFPGGAAGGIAIILNAQGGDNGMTPAGAESVDFSGNNFVAAKGFNALSFSSLSEGSVAATHDAITIDMPDGTLTLHDPGHGDSTSTFHGFLAVYGGAGDDVIVGSKLSIIGGGAGADTLTAGGHQSTFVYEGASDSYGVAHDTITNLDFHHDGFEVPLAVAAIDKTVKNADLNTTTLDSDLANALPGLQANHVVLVSAGSGDLAGHMFLVIDANGAVGYQANADMVIDITGAINTGNLTTSSFFDLNT